MIDGRRLLLDPAAGPRDADGRRIVEGTLTGYRSWAVGRVDGAFRLFPVFPKLEVTEPYPRGPATALCADGENVFPHRSPDATCACGFYAFWDLPAAAGYQSCRSHATVLGRVTAWGKVLPGEKGFRSEIAMVDAVFGPLCSAGECAAAVSQWLVRPHWTTPLTPGGRTFPRRNDRRHTAYREHGDFVAALATTAYLGWFCDRHAKADLAPPNFAEYVCNFPVGGGRRCRRQSAFALPGYAYSWCHEHAPLVLDAAAVMKDLASAYDLAGVVMGPPAGSAPISPDGPGNPPS